LRSAWKYRAKAFGTDPHGPSPVRLIDERISSARGTRRDSLVPRDRLQSGHPSCEFAPSHFSQGASPCDGFREVLPRRVFCTTCAGRRVALTQATVVAALHAHFSCACREAWIRTDPAARHGPFQSFRSERYRFPGRGLLVVRASRRFCRRIARLLQGFVLLHDRHTIRSFLCGSLS